VDGLDDRRVAQGALQDSGPEERGVVGGAAPRQDEAPGLAKEPRSVRRLEDPSGLPEERGLDPDHVVHVIRMPGPRIREGDHAVRMTRWAINVARTRGGDRRERRQPL